MDRPALDLLVLHANAWSGYLITKLFPGAGVMAWRADIRGDEVAERVSSHPAGAASPALLFHVDLSDTRRTPHGRRQLTQWLRSRKVPALNADCADLSRRRLQARLREHGLNSTTLDSHVDPDARVIVKTDPNHGGAAELRLSPAERAELGVTFEGGWFRQARDYRVLRRRDVPAEILAHPDYVVERYVDDGTGRFYRVYVSGTAVLVVKAHSARLIKAVRGDARDENWGFELDELEQVPETALAQKVARTIRTFVLCEDLHFGSIDIVMDEDGEPHVVDLNTTPWGGKLPVDAEILEFLRDGFAKGVELRRSRLQDVAVPAPEPPVLKGVKVDAESGRHHRGS